MVGPRADAVIRPPYRISGGPLYLGRRLAQAATSATTAFVQFASVWGWALNRLWGSPAAAQTQSCSSSDSSKTSGSPWPNGGAPPVGEAGGGGGSAGAGRGGAGPLR